MITAIKPPSVLKPDTKKKLESTINRLAKEPVESLRYRNFIAEHAKQIYKAVGIPMPKMQYNVTFDKSIQTIDVSVLKLSYRVINSSNQVLYYQNTDTFTTSPILISIWICMDVMDAIGIDTAPCVMTTTL